MLKLKVTNEESIGPIREGVYVQENPTLFEMEATDVVEIYTDGGLLSKNPSTKGGTWAWVAVDKYDQIVGGATGYVPAPEGRTVTNNHTEQMALVKAFDFLPNGWSGHVCSDSNVALGRVFRGERTTNLPKNIKDRTKAALARLGNMTYELLQGHPTKADLKAGIGKKRGLRVSKFNVLCDELCNESRARFESKGSAEVEIKSTNEYKLFMEKEAANEKENVGGVSPNCTEFWSSI